MLTYLSSHFLVIVACNSCTVCVHVVYSCVFCFLQVDSLHRVSQLTDVILTCTCIHTSHSMQKILFYIFCFYLLICLWLIYSHTIWRKIWCGKYSQIAIGVEKYWWNWDQLTLAIATVVKYLVGKFLTNHQKFAIINLIQLLLKFQIAAMLSAGGSFYSVVCVVCARSTV